MIEKYNVRILPGFCVLIIGEGIFQREKLKNNISFREQYTRLMGRKHGQKLIVRSSGMMEDSEKHLFPGIYRSVSGIGDVRALLEALEECYNSRNSDQAKWYGREVDVAKTDYFCVLIQRELKAEYSGILYTKLPFEGYWSGNCMMAQMVKGSSALLAKGIQNGNTYVFHEQLQHWDAEKEIHYSCLERNTVEAQMIEKKILGDLYKTGRKLVKIFENELDIEWAFYNGKAYIFQVRPIANKKMKNIDSLQLTDGMRSELFIEKGNDNGLKWNAMHYFIDNAMFEKKALLIDAHLSLEKIREMVYGVDFLSGGLTVRFY